MVSSLSFFPSLFFNMAMRKFKITLVSYKVFLMDSTALEICHLLQPYNFLQERNCPAASPVLD